MEKPIINGVEYAWGDFALFAFGQEIAQVTGIDYKTKKNKTALFAAGRMARSIQHGRREYDGTVTLLQSGVAALNRSAVAAGYTDLLDIEFDLIVKYANEHGILTIDKICNVSFSEIPKSLKEGDANMSIALPFLALRIIHDLI